MRRYLLRQYMHGEPSHDPANVTGTFDELKKAQAFAGMRLCDFNEIIDSDSWEVIWRLNKAGARRASAAPLALSIEPLDFPRTPGWFN
ncbi:MAG: hypothetical protein JWM30_3912 [Burkholderia sp.]|jgi:hypothetical protein|nr:hypothetical protein [Burkholderia sp.]